MIFPRFVFRVPGPISRAGGTYAELLTASQAEYEEALESGWHPSLLEAIEPPVSVIPVTSPEAHEPDAEVSPVVVIPPDDAPPTRAELETKATELGIKFDRRMGDKRLSALILEALPKEP